MCLQLSSNQSFYRQIAGYGRNISDHRVALHDIQLHDIVYVRGCITGHVYVMLWVSMRVTAK